MAASATANLTVRIRGRDDGAGATLSGVNRQLGAAGEGADNLERDLKKISGALTGIGIAAAAMGVALTSAFTSVMRTTKDFEAAMNRVRALITESGEAKGFEELKQRARELGATTEYTAAQVADGMRFLTMAGFTAKEALDAIGPSIDLASAGYLELAEAADIVTNIMTPFRLGADRTTEAVNALAITAANSNTDIKQLGEAMSYAAPIAADIGLTIQETSAAFGAMAKSGIRATRAGTAMRGMIASLAKPLPKTKAALERLGIQIAKNADGSVNLIETMRRLRDANWTAADAFEIFTRYAASGARVLSQNLATYDMITEKMAKGAITAKEMAEIGKRSGLEGALIKLSSAWQGLQEAMGEPLLMLKDYILQLANLLSKLTEWLRANPKVAKTIMIIVGALGTLLTLTGAVLTLVGGFGLLVGGLTAVGVAFSGLAIGVAAVTGAFAALAIGISQVIKYWDELKYHFIEDIKDIASTIDSRMPAIIEFTRQIYNLISSAQKRAQQAKDEGIIPEEDVEEAQKLYDRLVKIDSKLKELAKTGGVSQKFKAEVAGWKHLFEVNTKELQRFGANSIKDLEQMLTKTRSSLHFTFGKSAKDTINEVKQMVKPVLDYIGQLKKELSDLDKLFKKVGKYSKQMSDEITKGKYGLDIDQTQSDFEQYTKIVDDSMSIIVENTMVSANKMQKALTKAIKEGADPKTIEKLAEGIAKIAEKGIQEIEKLSDSLEASLRKREMQMREMHKRLEEMELQHVQQLQSIHDNAEAAMRNVARKRMTSEQKQADSRAYIWSRAYMAEKLIEEGSQESLTRAKVFAQQMASSASELKDPQQQMNAIQMAEQLLRAATLKLQQQQVEQQKMSILLMQQQIERIQTMREEIGEIVAKWEKMNKEQVLKLSAKQAKMELTGVTQQMQNLNQQLEVPRVLDIDTSSAEQKVGVLWQKVQQLTEQLKEAAYMTAEQSAAKAKELKDTAEKAAAAQPNKQTSPAGNPLMESATDLMTGAPTLKEASTNFKEAVDKFVAAAEKGVGIEVTAKGAIDTKVSNDTQYDNWR